MILVKNVTRGRLWVRWDHCRAPWLTPPRCSEMHCLHPHLRVSYWKCFGAQSSFSPCVCVVPSTVKVPTDLHGPYFFDSACASQSSCPGSYFLNFGKSHIKWMILTIADLVQKENPLELGVMRFAAANEHENSEHWQHIKSGTVIMAKGTSVSKSLFSSCTF